MGRMLLQIGSRLLVEINQGPNQEIQSSHRQLTRIYKSTWQPVDRIHFIVKTVIAKQP